MLPRHFKLWMEQRGYSAAYMASRLGVQERTVFRWRSEALPPYLWLALRAIDEGY